MSTQTTNDSTPRSGASGAVLDGLERWSGLALGLSEVLTGYSQRTLERAEAAPERAPGEARAADVVRVLPGALAAVAMDSQRRLFDVAADLEGLASTAGRRLGLDRLVRPALDAAYSALAPLDARFKADQSERARVAESFLAAAGPETLEEMLARVDLDALLAQVDLNSLLAQVDLSALLETVDLDEVARRIDVNLVLDRVDVDRLLDRVDINQVASLVVQQIEVTGLVRDGTGALANSTVGALRSQVEGVAGLLTGRTTDG